ncbi:septum site-determining protein Ssd [Mycobacterium sp. NPDC050041]|uniref:septum site-determining protein Ssd n=1 Tax=Mycobacterium sp. NPDC050041 TaxID=3364293 RepID=UPI003C2F4017
MTTTTGVLALLTDPSLRADVDRVAAAAGVTVVHAGEPSSRKAWTAAAAVLLDTPSARRCAQRALPRRGRVVLVGRTDPQEGDWQAAISVGAQHVITLPAQDRALAAELADAAESRRGDTRRGTAIAVLAGRGGAGASLFAAALAHVAPDALLVDTDPWSGGIDMVLGAESQPGLRWSDLSLEGGRLDFPALREALPRSNGVSVLSSGRAGTEIDAAALAAVVDAGCRGGAAVICDVPRRPTAAVEVVLDAADLVVLVVTADVRACAAAAAVTPWLTGMNPNVGVVVRGPAPGGLRPREVARAAGLPLLAAMRPQPGVAERLEQGALRLNRRSPLALAAGRVLAVLQHHPATEAA